MPAKTDRARLMELEAALWRELGADEDLPLVLPRFVEVLGRYLPIAALLVRRVEQPTLLLSMVAGYPAAIESTQAHRVELDQAGSRSLLDWAKRGEVAKIHRSAGLGALLLPEADPRHAVLAPLVVKGELLALAIVLFKTRHEVAPQHRRIMERALSPLAAAFVQAERVHELSRVRQALEADREALQMQRQEISDVVIGEAGGLRNVMERVELVARTDAPVLILGETGSGKEVIARAIHVRSKRALGPVVRVNCGAIPPELVDSELFGHEKGSFTGAVSGRQGWFERANGGTLFLDEVGELPPAAQVRLLRVLQDGSLERVGGQKTLHVDVRVVAATHRHLETMVADRTFREDLWYRLSIFPIRLPALRERMQDVPALVNHFAAHAGRRVGTSALKPTPTDIALLSAYDWPGNVRELAAVVERAAILGNGKRLEVELALGTSGRIRPRASLDSATDASDPESGPIKTLDQAMAQHIERALAATRGRIEGHFGAARLLKVNPHTLRAKMRKLGIDWTRYRQDFPADDFRSSLGS